MAIRCVNVPTVCDRHLYLHDATTSTSSIASRQVEGALAISLFVLGVVYSVWYCLMRMWKKQPTAW